MTLQTLKDLWQDNKLAIHNRQNKATFEALKILYAEPLPWTYCDENKEELIEVYYWQSLRKLKHFEYFFFEEESFMEDFEFTLEPTEILEIFNNNLCP